VGDCTLRIAGCITGVLPEYIAATAARLRLRRFRFERDQRIVFARFISAANLPARPEFVV